MAISKVQARKVRQPVVVSDHAVTTVLDATNTTEIITLSIVAEKITVQSTGTLAGDVTVSVDGVNFETGVSFVANTMANHGFNGTVHLIRVVKITRTSGSGQLHIVAV